MATPNYTLPDWLKAAPDPGREYTAAFSAGAQIAQEKARLAQAAQEAAMAATTRMQIAQQDNLQTQQRIEIEKNYQQQQIGLRKQALDQAQEKANLAATQAARRFAAQSQIKQAIASGMPADEAFLRFGSEAFGSAAGIAPLAKQVHDRLNPFAPTANKELGITQVSPGHWIRSAPSGVAPQAEPLMLKGTTNAVPGMFTAGGKIIKATVPADRSLKVQDDILKQKMTALNKTISLLDPSDPKEMDQQKEMQAQLSELEKQRISLARGGEGAAPAAQKIFRDKSGKKWAYSGSSANPLEDKDETHWKEIK